MSNDITRRMIVEAICTDTRARVEAHEWEGRGWRADQAIMLTALDAMQYMGTFTVYMSARDAAFSAGVSEKTGSAHLKGLCGDNWLTLDKTYHHKHETHHVNKSTGEVFTRAHIRWTKTPLEAYRYHLPVDRYMCNPHNFYRPAQPEGEGAPSNPSALPGTETLIRRLMKSCVTYTHSDVRRRLLIGRTNLGVELGPSKVAVMVALKEYPQRAKDIATLARMPASEASRILGDLRTMGLAVKDGARWKAGITLPELSVRMRDRAGFKPGTGRVDKRVTRWERERELWRVRTEASSEDFWLRMETETRFDRVFSEA